MSFRRPLNSRKVPFGLLPGPRRGGPPPPKVDKNALPPPTLQTAIVRESMPPPAKVEHFRLRQTSFPVPKKFALPPATDPILTYLTSHLLRDGKKHQAARTVSAVLNELHVLTKAKPLPILRSAIERASPDVKVVTQNMRGKSSLTPYPLTVKQRVGQAIKWIIARSDKRGEHRLEQRLALEMLAIIRGDNSEVLKKKFEVHKLALANRYFSFPSIRLEFEHLF